MVEYTRAHRGNLDALAHALETRGGHITTIGLGRNGQVGPALDPASSD